MATSTAHSNNTKLNDRILWYDGDSTLPESDVIDQVINGTSPTNIFVNELTDDITQYNKLVKEGEQISIKQYVNTNKIEWILPDPYNTLDVIDYVIAEYNKRIPEYKNDREELQRTNRITKELMLYKKYNLLDVLRVLIYIINTLQNNNVVWGVGRGSSVSSYVLYVIGVHDVDSYEYDLDISDFLH